MPQGKGTYGTKKGRPPIKNRYTAYETSGVGGVFSDGSSLGRPPERYTESPKRPRPDFRNYTPYRPKPNPPSRTRRTSTSLLPDRRIANPATQEEIARTNRNVGYAYKALEIGSYAVGGVGLLKLANVLRNPVAPYRAARKFLSNVGRNIKMTPNVGNVRLADTVGNRIKQAQAINPTLGKADWARFGQQWGKGQPVYNQRYNRKLDMPELITVGRGGTTSLLGMGKGGRTLQKAVEQGPVKFFSKGRHPKTGVAPFKRFDRKYGLMPRNQVNPKPNPTNKK
jgi:hypothetical protein